METINRMITVNFLPEEHIELIELLENDLITAKREKNEKMIELYERLIGRLKQAGWDLK